MKFGIRGLSATVGIIALIAAGLSYWAGEQLSMASKEGGETRDVTFKSYRIAQSLKSLAAGYELTMNEFYSTVLEFPAYQKKSAAQRAAIDAELATLATMQDGGAATAAQLTQLYKEIDGFRLALEGAMTSTEKDWDQAREALFKMNVLSVRAIHLADLLGKNAHERATTLEMSGQAYQSQALLLLRIVAALALGAGIAILIGSTRMGRADA